MDRTPYRAAAPRLHLVHESRKSPLPAPLTFRERVKRARRRQTSRRLPGALWLLVFASVALVIVAALLLGGAR